MSIFTRCNDNAKRILSIARRAVVLPHGDYRTLKLATAIVSRYPDQARQHQIDIRPHYLFGPGIEE